MISEFANEVFQRQLVSDEFVQQLVRPERWGVDARLQELDRLPSQLRDVLDVRNVFVFPQHGHPRHNALRMVLEKVSAQLLEVSERPFDFPLSALHSRSFNYELGVVVSKGIEQ